LYFTGRAKVSDFLREMAQAKKSNSPTKGKCINVLNEHNDLLVNFKNLNVLRVYFPIS
jgi:hypothetical protein